MTTQNKTNNPQAVYTISEKQLKAIKELKKAVAKFERGEDYGDELYAAASKVDCLF